MSTQIISTTTAGINPEQFSDGLFFTRKPKVVAVVLALFLLIGFALRVSDLGVESLGEDELNKLQTVEEYRINGLSGKNGEHPFLMKGLQTLSISAAEKLKDYGGLKIAEEAALRFPVALFGSLTALLIFLLVRELFGQSIALVSAALWSIEPMAVGFDRIAKEDSLVLFFFLLTNLFWIRGQTAAERGGTRWTWFAWAAAAGFAALMATKYYPYMLGITAGYYIIFQYIPATKWRMESVRWLKFFTVMGAAFVILNPTILLPETWLEMLKFSSENRIGHDSYEFMGTLYRNEMSAWLAGVPWTFYFVFAAVKTSLVTLAFFLIGLPVLIRRKMGDGRFFMLFWAGMWLISFTFLGGKFTRYFTLAEPLLLITAAGGFCFLVRSVSGKLAGQKPLAGVFQMIALAVFLAVPVWNSLAVTPHFRMFTNELGGGMAVAGYYFPHDEFYDAGTQSIVSEIVARARPGATVASETPELFVHYARKAGRADLIFISLSEPMKVAGLRPGDFIVLTRGRRYFSNTAYEDYLTDRAAPVAETRIAGVTAATVYQLEAAMPAGIQS